MAKLNLNEILAKRAEATGGDGTQVEFEYTDEKGVKHDFTFRDPQMLSDDEKIELEELGNNDIDVAEWFLGGPENYDAFLAAGGSSSAFFQLMREYSNEVTAEVDGNPTRPNRSARRSAASKKRKAR